MGTGEESSYEKPIKRFFVLLSLLISSPIMLSLAFKSLHVYTEKPKIYIAYILMFLGIVMIVYTVYFGLRTIKLLLDVLFRK